MRPRLSALVVLAALVSGCASVPTLGEVRGLVEGPEAPRSSAALPDSLTATVAVLAFANETGDPRYDPFGRGLAHMMTTDLAAVPTLRLVERDQLQALVDELELQQSGAVDSTTALEMGRFVGAEHVVVGAITGGGAEVRLDTRVVRVETSEVVQAESVSGPEGDLFALQRGLAEAIIDGIGVVLSDEARAALAAEQEANRLEDVEAALAFSSALALYDRGEYTAAAEQLAAVQRRSPGSAMVRTALAMAIAGGRARGLDALRGAIDRRLRGEQ